MYPSTLCYFATKFPAIKSNLFQLKKKIKENVNPITISPIQ